jgi:hypothetical protein
MATVPLIKGSPGKRGCYPSPGGPTRSVLSGGFEGRLNEQLGALSQVPDHIGDRAL